MKKQSLLLLPLLIGAFIASAQTAATSTMVQMIEWKYKSARELQSTYGVSRAYWMEKMPEITSRFGFTSETGRFYGFTNTDGMADMGKYIGAREQVTESFKKDHPDVYKKIIDNMDGPSIRSYWKIADDISNTSQDYDPNKFDYRKMILFSVPNGTATQFEDLMKEVIKEEKRTGIDLTRIYAKSMEGFAKVKLLDEILFCRISNSFRDSEISSFLIGIIGCKTFSIEYRNDGNDERGE